MVDQEAQFSACGALFFVWAHSPAVSSEVEASVVASLRQIEAFRKVWPISIKELRETITKIINGKVSRTTMENVLSEAIDAACSVGDKLVQDRRVVREELLANEGFLDSEYRRMEKALFVACLDERLIPVSLPKRAQEVAEEPWLQRKDGRPSHVVLTVTVEARFSADA